MDFQIVSVTNRIPGDAEPYYRYPAWLKSIQKFDMEPTVLGMNQPWHGLMTKPRTLRQWLRDGKNEAQGIIVCDAWDLAFCRDPRDLWNDYRERWSGIVFNAERNCFPRPDLASRFTDMGTPFRYLNSGFFCGMASEILVMLEMMDLDSIPDDHEKDGKAVNPCDQEYYQLAYLNSIEDGLMKLDSHADLCLCLHDFPEDKLHLEQGLMIFNSLTETHPYCLHGNGNGKELLNKAITHLGLE